MLTLRRGHRLVEQRGLERELLGSERPISVSHLLQDLWFPRARQVQGTYDSAHPTRAQEGPDSSPAPPPPSEYLPDTFNESRVRVPNV